MDDLFTIPELAALSKGRECLSKTREMYIFGAGFTGIDFLKRLRRSGRDAAGFVDNNPGLQGKKIEGLSVFSPEVLAREHANAHVIVALYATAEVMAQCRELGFTDAMMLKDFLNRFGDLGEAERLLAEPDVVEAATIWDDAESEQVYRRLLRHRITLEPSDLPSALPNQYFNATVVPADSLRSYVDCGACVGDTLALLRRFSRDGYENYYGFEPDPSFYARLVAEAAGDPRVETFNLATGRKAGSISFNAAATPYSRALENGDTTVQMDSLDHVLGDRPVTMIKMDIEGSEAPTLEGARGIICNQRPALAICVYHKMEDLWNLPLWIARLGLGYRLKLLHHHPYNQSETVCYALPF